MVEEVRVVRRRRATTLHLTKKDKGITNNNNQNLVQTFIVTSSDIM